MALITCPECGRQISDRAEICVGCGYPIASYIKENQKHNETVSADDVLKHLDISLDEIYSTENGRKVLMIKKVRELTGCDLEIASQLINQYLEEKFPEKELHYTPQKDIPQKNYNSNVIDISKRPLTPRDGEHPKGDIFTKIKCPVCWSIEFQILGTKKKFSIGKALVGNTVGGILLGPAGAIAGTFEGVHGKDGKTKFICNHCGKVWEQKV